MLKFTKQHIYLLISIILIALPNLLLIVIGEDSVIMSSIKKVAFLIFSMAFVLFPLILIKPKYYAVFGLIITPLMLFEFVNVYLFKVPSSEEAIASIFYTNLHETTELIKSNLIYLLFYIIIFIIQLFLVFKLKKQFKLHKKIRRLLFISSIFIFGVMYIRDYKIASKIDKYASFNDVINKTNYFYQVKLDKVFPLDILRKVSRFSKNLDKIKNYNKTIKNFKFNTSKKDTLSSSEIYVLILGETARKYNFGNFGYSRNTTPNLSKIKNLNLFTDVKSSANLTAISLPFIITRATPINFEVGFTEPAIINAYKEAGFKTYWLTNQPAGIGGVYGFYSRLADVYKSVAVSSDAAKLDEELFPELDIILQDLTTSKKFIIIHTQGSHFRYNFRHSEKFEKFKPVISKGLSIGDNNKSLKAEFTNSYDNSILYTDYILSEIIKKIEQTNTISFIYYISDHGENLFDDENEYFLHGFMQPSKYETDIPIMIWNSELYKNIYTDKIKALIAHRSSKISTINTFHTLLDLSNISYPEENLKKSFANKSFDTLQTRYILNPNKKLIKLD